MINKTILDVCCGGKMFYFNKSDPRVLFCDIRDIETTLCDGRTFKVKPDLQCDFTNLPLPDNLFRLVIYDPPHLLRNTGKSKMNDMYGSLNSKAERKGWQHTKYGELHKDWHEMLKKGFSECFRVLQPGGILVFKWSEIDIKLSEILKLTPYIPLLGHKSGKANKTHWVLFVKSEVSA